MPNPQVLKKSGQQVEKTSASSRASQQSNAQAFKAEKQKQGKFKIPQGSSGAGTDRAVVSSQDTAPNPNISKNISNLPFQQWAEQNQAQQHIQNLQKNTDPLVAQRVPEQKSTIQRPQQNLGESQNVQREFENPNQTSSFLGMKVTPYSKLTTTQKVGIVGAALAVGGAAALAFGAGGAAAEVPSAVAGVGKLIYKWDSALGQGKYVAQTAAELATETASTGYGSVVGKVISQSYSTGLGAIARNAGKFATNIKNNQLLAFLVSDATFKIIQEVRAGKQRASEDPSTKAITRYNENTADAIKLKDPLLLAQIQQERDKTLQEFNDISGNTTLSQYAFGKSTENSEVDLQALNRYSKFQKQAENLQLAQSLHGLSKTDIFEQLDLKQSSDLSEKTAEYDPLISVASASLAIASTDAEKDIWRQKKGDLEQAKEKAIARIKKDTADLKLHFIDQTLSGEEIQDRIYGNPDVNQFD